MVCTFQKSRQRILDKVDIIIPHSLHIEWTELPPFRVASEIARHLTDTLINNDATVHIHQFKQYCVPTKDWKYKVYRQQITSLSCRCTWITLSQCYNTPPLFNSTSSLAVSYMIFIVFFHFPLSQSTQFLIRFFFKN